MNIFFTKMQGLGNDFMVIDGISQKINLTPEIIRTWSHRHHGIGFDQLLLVEKQAQDFLYRIFNADGSEVYQCGNGARCLAKFLHEKNLTKENPVRVKTQIGELELKIETDGNVTVGMGTPNIHALLPSELDNLLPINTKIFSVSLGNPHCVILVETLDQKQFQALASRLSNHPLFPEKTNVELVKILNPHQIELWVYERGVGETSACGSGACAAVVAGRAVKKLEETVEVIQRGGSLKVHWKGENQPIHLTGPAEKVFEGSITCK